jgi:exosortase A
VSVARQVGIAVPRPTAWPAALFVLGLGLAALGILFHTEVAAAVSTWDRSSAYGHCWLVLPIAAWLAWTRRELLADLAPEPLPLAAPLALGGAAAWLVMEQLGVMEGRQFAALGLVWVLVLSVFGWRVVRAMAAPLAYLVFLVPFGEFATPWLQEATLQMILLGLDIAGIPYHADGLVIEIPAGTFLVAEACAGLRFLIAALAFGALYAIVMFRDPWRRLLVLALAVVVPLVANGIRAFGIVLLGHHLGSAEAAAADHVIYGWAFFSVVILLLILAGLPFRQEPALAIRPPAMSARLAAPRALAAAGVATVALAAAGPLAAAALDAGLPPPQREAGRLAAPAGCEMEGLALHCGGATVRATLIRFAPRSNWAVVAAARHEAIGLDDEALIFDVSGPGMRWTVRQREGGREDRSVAVAAWLSGSPVGLGLRTRAAQAWRRIAGGEGAPVLAVVALTSSGEGDGARDRRILRAVLLAQQEALARQAAEYSRR